MRPGVKGTSLLITQSILVCSYFLSYDSFEATHRRVSETHAKTVVFSGRALWIGTDNSGPTGEGV